MSYAMKLTNDVYDHLSKNFDDKMIEKLLKIAIVSMEGYLEEINKNMMLENTKELLNDFHAFQGMLINLGLKKEAETARQIQTVLKQNGFSNINALIKDFIKLHFIFLYELKKTMK